MSDNSFRIRAALACGVGVVLAFAVLSIVTYDLWTVAVTAAVLFLLTATAVVFEAMRLLPLANAWIFAAVAFPVAWGLLQLALHRSVYPFFTWENIIEYGEAACCFWLLLQVCQSERIRNRCRLAVAMFGAGFAVLSLLQMFTSPESAYWIISLQPQEQGMGPFQNQDHYAAFMELLLPVVAWDAMRGRRSAPLFGVAAIVMYASVIATLSRAGSILATLELVLVCVVALVRRRAFAVRRAGIAAVVLAGVAILIGSTAGLDLLLQRFETKDPFAHRREYSWSSVEMAKTRPLFGYGLGTWPIVYPRFATFDPGTFANHAHNEWVEWACEGGLPLVAAFVVIALRSGWLAWKLPAALGVPAVLLHSTVDFNMREHPIPLVMMALLAWAEASVRAGDTGPRPRPPRDSRRSEQLVPERIPH